MNKLIIRAFRGIILCCPSCNQGQNMNQPFTIIKTYVKFNNSGFEISMIDSLLPMKNWQEDNILDSMTIYYNKEPITVRKISNYPNDPIDGSYVAYQENNLGIFYLKTITWKDFILLRTNNDSINN